MKTVFLFESNFTEIVDKIFFVFFVFLYVCCFVLFCQREHGEI